MLREGTCRSECQHEAQRRTTACCRRHGQSSTMRKRDTTGGYDNRVSSARPKTCHSLCVTARAVGHPTEQLLERDRFSCVFRTPRSAPISPRNRVSNHDWTCVADRTAIKRPKTRAVLVTGGRTSRLSRTNAVRVWGSPWDRREPPENWVVGCETSRGKERSLTLSAFNRPQFTHIHSKIFFTFTMKPEDGLSEAAGG